MKRVALATSQSYKALTTDDQALLGPLTAWGISGEPVIWSDQHFPWPSLDAVILRSCWDYHLRLPEFLTWLTYLEEMKVPVWNAPSLQRWNSDKVYLRDLEAKGISIIPTIWPEQGACLDRALACRWMVPGCGQAAGFCDRAQDLLNFGRGHCLRTTHVG